ncbi:hypothetical protein [Prochlorococcus sp. MIT 1223]|uniref:hypothetical protein n=1 Tax=Prochlorococcus sp. MIT 1223 TaxID=3096217 RepID=UPI002A75390F|nr:hypothetical protein [Prochlorococcus sp. MIT 1223]
MNPIFTPMGSLTLAFAIVSIFWIAKNIVEGRKAENQIREAKIKKFNNSSIYEQKKRLNQILNK